MNDKSDLVLFGIDFALGVLVPAGLLYIITSLPLPDSLGETVSIALPVLWFALIVVMFMG